MPNMQMRMADGQQAMAVPSFSWKRAQAKHKTTTKLCHVRSTAGSNSRRVAVMSSRGWPPVAKVGRVARLLALV